MKYYYSIRINCDAQKIGLINEILGLSSNMPGHNWGYEVEEEEGDPAFLFVEKFIDVLAGKYEELETINVYKSDISLWMLYEYDDQCNMEFGPSQLAELGKSELSLCISCWRKD